MSSQPVGRVRLGAWCGRGDSNPHPLRDRNLNPEGTPRGCAETASALGEPEQAGTSEPPEEHTSAHASAHSNVGAELAGEIHRDAPDADLARLAARWPALPVEVRRALLVLAGIPQEPAP